MLEIPFVAVEAALVVVWLLVRVALCVYRRGIDLRKEFLSLLMLVNVAVILRFALFPFSLVDGHVQPLVFDASLAFPPRLNLVPFAELFTYDTTGDMLINLIGNCALFVPSGVLLPIVYPQLDSFSKVVGAGALISIATEILQLPFYERVTDVNDFMLNVLGVVIGYGIYALFGRLISKARLK